MSRENVEVVRRIYADWAQGRFASVDLLDPEIEFVLADGPFAGSYKGLAAMAQVTANGYRLGRKCDRSLISCVSWTANASCPFITTALAGRRVDSILAICVGRRRPSSTSPTAG